MQSAFKLLMLLCVAATELLSRLPQTSGELVSSTARFHGFASLDLAAGLNRYIQHETKRLEIIKTTKGYEEEVPVVKTRLQKLQQLSQQVLERQAESAQLRRNLHDFHPTTALRLISHFLDTWHSKLKNDTLYGFRFAEFLSNDDDSKLPREEDLQLAARAVVEIQYIYNLSTGDVYGGRVMGHQGTPLRPRDAYLLAVTSHSLQHLHLAVQWYETALNNTPPHDLELFSKGVLNASSSSPSAYPIPSALASLGVLKYGMNQKAEGLELLEKATDMDPDDQILRLYLSHRYGRDVPPLVHSDVGEFRRRWFQLCANSSSEIVRPLKWYHVCRYRQSPQVPYRRYREEVLSRTPFLSVLHGFLSAPRAAHLVNVSVGKLVSGATLEGLGSELVLVEGAVLNHSVPAARLLSEGITDLTGLDTAERTPLYSSGEPLHVLNYGVSGSFLPHYDVYRVYDNRKHVMRRSGHRMASVLVYLSDVKAGGATAFPYLNLTVRPETGKALLWYNTDPTGMVERDIIHAGCTVAVGAKWVASKGIWSWGNELRRPCGPKVTSSHLVIDKLCRQRSFKSRKNT
ncbi:prolyl 4-hydroxylase subunit alpha-1-like [Babylonia areolata]|uniref:prolyl 4-hydroxylase subunit alpha-1-like n=1 Tax=Babylonia areolata TaxID=304850 RepID=UPI003FD4A37B